MANSQSDIADWNRNAETYSSVAGIPEDRLYDQFREILWNCLDDVTGLNVLDLGCGHGWLTSMLRDRGARVIGVDGSAQMLERSRALCPDVQFLCHDLAQGLPNLNRSFDLITAYMVLMDLPVLEPLFRNIQLYSRPGTRLIATINHPCFFNMDVVQDSKGSWFRKVTSYLSHETWRISSFGGHNHYHRPLMFYFETLRSAGFVVRRFFEPAPIPADDAEAREFRRKVPVFLLLEAVYAPDLVPKSDT